jgi:hypothetical protein
MSIVYKCAQRARLNSGKTHNKSDGTIKPKQHCHFIHNLLSLIIYLPDRVVIPSGARRPVPPIERSLNYKNDSWASVRRSPDCAGKPRFCCAEQLRLATNMLALVRRQSHKAAKTSHLCRAGFSPKTDMRPAQDHTRPACTLFWGARFSSNNRLRRPQKRLKNRTTMSSYDLTWTAVVDNGATSRWVQSKESEID